MTPTTPDTPADDEPPARPVVSVLIPTYQRRELLLHTIDTLRDQTLSPAKFEVIVADDGSTDGTQNAVTDAAQGDRWPFPVRLLSLDHAGPAHARNKAAARASAPILAFLDSDVEAAAQWLAAGVAAFADGGVGAVEGRTEVGPGLVTPFTHQTQNHGGGYPTCNLLVRKTAFEEIGGFDPDFGGKYFFREDTELAFRILDRGYTIPYEPDALVLHPPLPAKWITPLRLARRYRYEPLLWAKHPVRARTSVSVQRVGPLTLHRPRHRLYTANVVALLGTLACLVGGAPLAGAALLAGYGLTLLGILALHLRHATPCLKTAAHTVALAPLILLIPWVFAYSILEGLWLRRRARTHPTRRPQSATENETDA